MAKKESLKKKLPLAIGLVVLAVVAAAFYLFRSNQAKTFTIESDDGSLTLEIPKGALPDGVKKEDLSITTLPVEGSDGLYASYELTPDGLKFRQPVTAIATLPMSDGNIPLAYLVSQGSMSTIAPSKVSQKGETMTVTAHLSHFSFLFFREGPFIIGLSIPEDIYEVTDTFPLTFAVLADPVWQDEEVWEMGGRKYGSKLELETVEVNGTIGPFSDIVEPPEYTIQDTFDPSTFYSRKEDFDCAKPGVESMSFLGTLEAKGKIYSINDKGEWERNRVAESLQEIIGGEEFEIPGEPTGDTFSEQFENFFELIYERSIEVECVAKVTVGTLRAGVVTVLVYEGNYFPKSQFHIGKPDACPKDHWHAKSTVYGVDSLKKGANIILRGDPNPRACGFGTTDEVPIKKVELPNEVLDKLFENIPE